MLCLLLGIPLLAIDTFEGEFLQVKVDSGFIVPMLDARRMEVYSYFNANLGNKRNTNVLKL
jgi:tRNA threonylcarbamoyladenosine biosynthesis protein TsaB